MRWWSRWSCAPHFCVTPIWSMAVGCRPSHSCLTSWWQCTVSSWCGIHLKDPSGSWYGWDANPALKHQVFIYPLALHILQQNSPPRASRYGGESSVWRNQIDQRSKIFQDEPSGSLFLDLQCVSVCSLMFTSVYTFRWLLRFRPAAAAKFQNAQMLQWRWHGDHCLLPKAQWASEL